MTEQTLIWLLILGMPACATSQTSSDTAGAASDAPRYETETQNWEEGEHAFPDGGAYYEYRGDAEQDTSEKRLQSGEMLLGMLIGEGVELTDAWHKARRNSCSPPGSKMASSVIVRAVLIVRTEDATSEQLLRDLGFSPTDTPQIGHCAYDVTHYAFE